MTAIDRRTGRLVSALPSDLARVHGGGERCAVQIHRLVSERLPEWDCVGLSATSRPEEVPLPTGWRSILGGHGELPPPADALSTRALTRAYLRADVIIVHQWETRACALARAMRILRPRVQIAVFDHGGGSAVGRQLAATQLPLPDVAAVQSEFEAALTPMRAKRVAMVRGGISRDLFYADPTSSRSIDFLLVGRFEPHKGQLQLLKALPPQSSACLVGSAGTHRPEYRDQVLAEAAAGQVPVIVGATDTELLQTYQSARFIVQVPIRASDPAAAPPELLGLTLLEGMACGCIPICPSTGPGAEFVRDGSNGFTYEAESVADLARALRRAQLGEFDLEATSQGAIAESANWTWEAASEKLIAALSSSTRSKRAIGSSRG